MRVSIRPASEADLDYLVGLYAHDDVRPWLAPGGAYDREALARRIAADPDEEGVVLFEVDGERAGAAGWRRTNERSRIANLGALAVDPAYRGRRVADEAAQLLQRHLLLERGFHRLELEVYRFNERALKHAERAGFVREGVKRRAYLREDGWVDSVCFGLVLDDLEREG